MRVLQIGVLATVVTVCLAMPLRAQDHEHPKVRVPPDDLSGEESAAVELYRRVLPTVVTIFTTHVNISPNGPITQEGLGSGVLISPAHHVLTAAHLVESAREIRVKVHDGRSYAAELLYSESSADIALIRLLGTGDDLQFAILGDSDRGAQL